MDWTVMVSTQIDYIIKFISNANMQI